MADFGLIVGIGSTAVETATPEETSVHSKYPMPSILLGQNPGHFGVYTNTWGSNPGVGQTTVIAINHGLSYRPAAIVYIKDTEAGVDFIGPLEAGPNSYQYFAYTTTTQLIIAISRFDTVADLTGQVRTFKYYIFGNIPL